MKSERPKLEITSKENIYQDYQNGIIIKSAKNFDDT